MTVIGDGQFWMGLDPAAQVKLTITFVLFHPAALGGGEMIGVIVGGTAG